MPPPAPIPVHARASTSGGPALRCEIAAGMQAPFRDAWPVVTDEPRALGGTAAAPPPLVLMAAALAGCLATQLRAFARPHGIALTHVAVTADLRWHGERQADGTTRARPEGIDIDIGLAGDAPPERLVDLTMAAARGCYVEALVDPAIPLRHRLTLGGTRMRLPDPRDAAPAGGRA